jgi:hypothetical protein
LRRDRRIGGDPAKHPSKAIATFEASPMLCALNFAVR